MHHWQKFGENLSIDTGDIVETSVGTVTETGTETAVFWQNRTEAKPRFYAP